MISSEQIIEAAIHVFAYKPDATMNDVANAAGVTRITVNRKFGSKKDLLEQAEKHCIQEFQKIFRKTIRTNRPAVDKINTILQEFSALKDYYFFWLRSVVDNNPRNTEVFMSMLDELEKLVVSAQQQGDLRSDLPSGWIAAFFDYMVIAGNKTLSRGVVAERDLPRVTWETLMHGIAPKKFF